jgi:hypothetical protein
VLNHGTECSGISVPDDAFDLQALYKKNMHQVTIHVTIADSTPRAVAAIINDASDHPGSTAPEPGGQAPFSDVAQAPMAQASYHDHGNRDRADRPPAYGASFPASFSGLTSQGRSS